MSQSAKARPTGVGFDDHDTRDLSGGSEVPPPWLHIMSRGTPSFHGYSHISIPFDWHVAAASAMPDFDLFPDDSLASMT